MSEQEEGRAWHPPYMRMLWAEGTFADWIAGAVEDALENESMIPHNAAPGNSELKEFILHRPGIASRSRNIPPNPH